MEFEWDPVKNASNRQKHGISFLSVETILQGPCLYFDSLRNGEARTGAIGLLNGKQVVVFYIMRENWFRIISIRRARPDEVRQYRELYQ